MFYLDVIKPFDTVAHNSLISVLKKWSGNEIIRWWVNTCLEKPYLESSCDTGRMNRAGFPLGFVLSPALVTPLIIRLGKGTEYLPANTSR